MRLSSPAVIVNSAFFGREQITRCTVSCEQTPRTAAGCHVPGPHPHSCLCSLGLPKGLWSAFPFWVLACCFLPLLSYLCTHDFTMTPQSKSYRHPSRSTCLFLSKERWSMKLCALEKRVSRMLSRILSLELAFFFPLCFIQFFPFLITSGTQK